MMEGATARSGAGLCARLKKNLCVFFMLTCTFFWLTCTFFCSHSLKKWVFFLYLVHLVNLANLLKTVIAKLSKCPKWFSLSYLSVLS